MRLIAILLLCSCSRAEPWPDWPADPETARLLTDAHTLRAPGPAAPPLTGDAVMEEVRLRTQAGATRVGWPAIVAWLKERVEAHPDRPFYLLWGNAHDAPVHIAALGRVLGPLGVPAPWRLVAEPFSATGRWGGVPAECQRGDELLLGRYRTDGSRAALRAIVDHQFEHSATARRYGVLDAMADLMVTLRASDVPVLGCDAPRCLAERLWDTTDDESMRTRELHCVLALRHTLGTHHSPERVAMLWGRAHVASDGVSRYLPRDADVVSVRVLGGRHSDTSIGSAISGRLGLTEPVLLPRKNGAAILLLPDHRSFARRVRKQDLAVTPSELINRVFAFAQTPGELIVAGGRVHLDLDSIRVPAKPGHLPFVFVATDGFVLVGGVDVAPGSWVEIEIDARSRLVVTTEHPPNPNIGYSERL